MGEHNEAYEKAKGLAMRRLGRRESAAGEMRQYLIEKGFAVDVVAPIVSMLVERGYISDMRFASMLARELTRSGKGPAYIRGRLLQKGIRLEIKDIKSLIEEDSQISEHDAVRALLKKMGRGALPTAREERAKLIAKLVRRGFSFAIVQEVMRDWQDQ